MWVHEYCVQFYYLHDHRERVTTRGMHTIAVVNSKGGVGKSTISCLLAFYFHEKKIRTGLLDGDANESSSRWVTAVEPGIAVHTAPAGLDIVDFVQTAKQKNQFDILIGDGPGSLHEPTRAFMLAADLVLIPCGASSMDLDVTAKVIHVLKKAQAVRDDGGPLGFLVLSKVPHKRRKVTKRAFERAKALGLPLCSTTLGARDAFVNAVDEKTPLWEMGADAAMAVQEIDELLWEIITYAKTHKKRTDR